MSPLPSAMVLHATSGDIDVYVGSVVPCGAARETIAPVPSTTSRSAERKRVTTSLSGSTTTSRRSRSRWTTRETGPELGKVTSSPVAHAT